METGFYDGILYQIEYKPELSNIENITFREGIVTLH